MLSCNFLHNFCAWDLLNFLNMCVYGFYQFRKILTIISSNFFLFSLSSGILIAYIDHLIFLCSLSMSCTLLFDSFSSVCFTLNYFYCFNFKFTIFSSTMLICHQSYPSYFSTHTFQFSSLEIWFGHFLYLTCIHLTFGTYYIQP